MTDLNLYDQSMGFSTENLYDHFKNNHDEKVMIHGLKILDKENSLLFNKYLQRNYYSICNMFITRVKYFKKYINFIFPILNEILDFCLKENLCKGKNIRLPVFFIERFTSFWFEYYTKVGYLSYAFLNKYFTINLINNSFNVLKNFLQFSSSHLYGLSSDCFSLCLSKCDLP